MPQKSQVWTYEHCPGDSPILEVSKTLEGAALLMYAEEHNSGRNQVNE